MAKARGKVNRATERARQQRLRDRRREAGWRRLSIWLTPDEANTVEALGDEWLGRAVKALLCDCMKARGQPLSPPIEPFVLTPDTVPDNTPDIMPEVVELRAKGLSWVAIAEVFNRLGQRTKKGAAFISGNLSRDYRKWKGE